MKKQIRIVTAVVLSLTLLLGMSATALANNGNNGNGPNNRPHGDTLTIEADNGSEIVVRIEHRNRLGQFFIIHINGEFAEEVLTDTGTFVTSLVVGDYALSLSVQGNSLRGGEAKSLYEPGGPCDLIPEPEMGTLTVLGGGEMAEWWAMFLLISANFDVEEFLFSLVQVEALGADELPTGYSIVDTNFSVPFSLYNWYYMEIALDDYPEVLPVRVYFLIISESFGN